MLEPITHCKTYFRKFWKALLCYFQYFRRMYKMLLQGLEGSRRIATEAMLLDIKDSKLERVYYEDKFTGGLSAAMVYAVQKVIGAIDQAPDERALYAMRSLRLEKLKRPGGEHSLRLNDQFRLIVKLEGEAPNKVVAILGIEDYH
jgi:proteic killer suppression protein